MENKKQNTLKNLNAEDLILFLGVKFNNDWNSIYRVIAKKERLTEEEKEQAIDFTKKFKGFYSTIMSDNYPLILKRTNKPPFVIFDKSTYEALKSLEETMDL